MNQLTDYCILFKFFQKFEKIFATKGAPLVIYGENVLTGDLFIFDSDTGSAFGYRFFHLSTTHRGKKG
jgi:hypothetical protein